MKHRGLLLMICYVVWGCNNGYYVDPKPDPNCDTRCDVETNGDTWVDACTAIMIEYNRGIEDSTECEESTKEWLIRNEMLVCANIFLKYEEENVLCECISYSEKKYCETTAYELGKKCYFDDMAIGPPEECWWIRVPIFSPNYSDEPWPEEEW